jgi:hypothetical protein
MATRFCIHFADVDCCDVPCSRQGCGHDCSWHEYGLCIGTGCICTEFDGTPVIRDLHAEDLSFILELKSATPEKLRELQINLHFGGPEWQRIAVEREVSKRLV